MYLGIDLGTSSVKALLVDEKERVVGTAQQPLAISRPQPGASEQDPRAWWTATLAVVDELAARHANAMSQVNGIGLAGQMHGAVLLDSGNEVLRPAMLWNDGRAQQECVELEALFPQLPAVTGNRAMPGFTAPKLLWVRRHEPALFDRIATVLLPKAYLRLHLCGEAIEEMSDASGTLWLDVGSRDWSDAALAATGLNRRQMPRLVEGTDACASLLPALARRWGMASAPVIAGGAGDNAAGAIGLGAIHPDDAFVSLGTSGVLWATTGTFRPNPDSGVHAFCHAIPDTWHQMGVVLAAASSLAWFAELTGASEASLLAELPERPRAPSPVMFLPYLAGDRTPHNDGSVRGAFAGIGFEAGRQEFTQAVLEGVAFSFKDCLRALAEAGTQVRSAAVIGGGARSTLWLSILATVLELPLYRVAGAEHCTALGAARLGRKAATGMSVAELFTHPPRDDVVEPDRSLVASYAARYQIYRGLYAPLVASTRLPPLQPSPARI